MIKKYINGNIFLVIVSSSLVVWLHTSPFRLLNSHDLLSALSLLSFQWRLLFHCFQCHIEGFHSRDLYTKANFFEGIARQENSNLGSKRFFAVFLLPMALFGNAGVSFIQNHPLGTRLEGSKNPPLGTIIVYKNPPPRGLS